MLPAMDFRGQEALLSSRVLVVGMGGLGCAAAPYLVASGIGHITLVDDDLIDRTNLPKTDPVIGKVILARSKRNVPAWLCVSSILK